METLTFKAFRATDEPALCAEFLRQHRKVLEDFGITNVTTNNEAWTKDPNTFVIVAVSDVMGMVGGIRLEVDSGSRELPMQAALYELDQRIASSLDRLREQGNAEVCGLWNANQYSSRGLPSMLAAAAVSLGNQIGVHSMVCLVAHYTLRHALKVGFSIIEGVGDEGTFTYPIPSIKAIAMVIPDVITLRSAPAEYRKHLMSLRIRPGQERMEIIGGVRTLCKYDLCIDRKVLHLTTYLNIQGTHQYYAATA